jgi:hypothetical protein
LFQPVASGNSRAKASYLQEAYPMKRLLLGTVFIIAGSVVASAQSITYYFPQVAVGGGWMTTIFISNTMTTGAGAATITFTKSDGTPFRADWLDEMGNNVTNGNNVIGVRLASGETRKFVSVGNPSLITGFATVSTDSSALLGNAMFTELDNSGNLLAEAGVPMAIPLIKQALFVDTTNGFRTGLAVANPNNLSLQLHFQLFNDTGQVVTSSVVNIGPFQQMAVFADQLFQGIPAMVGQVQVSSTSPVAAVGLRFDASGLPFTTLTPLAVAN